MGKKLKVTLSEKRVYCIDLYNNTENNGQIVFEADKIDECYEYLKNLPEIPRYIVINENAKNLELLENKNK